MPGSKKAEKRLAARIDAWQNETAKRTEHGFDMHKPGSQNRNK